MSLHDRDYYREEETNSWGEWLDARGAATVIGLTCAVFLLQLFTSPSNLGRQRGVKIEGQNADLRATEYDGIRRHTDLYLPDILSGEVWRVATAFWVHNGVNAFVSVVFGMLMIYFIGKPLEQVIGGKEFFAFYWFAGLFIMTAFLIGKLLQKYVFGGVLPFQPEIGACGSYGPVTAVMGLFALKYWDQPVRFMFAIQMPAWGAVALILGITLLLSLGNVELLLATALGLLAAWLYHASGIRIVDRMPKFGRSRAGTERRLSRLKLVPPPDDEPIDSEPLENGRRRYESRAGGRDHPVAVVDEQLEAKLDRVLDKVAKSGTDSLSAEERGILLQASEAYKRRRGG